MHANAALDRTTKPHARLNASHLALLRRLRAGDVIASINGADFRDVRRVSFAESNIEVLRRAGLVRFVQCGPDSILAIHLELTEAGCAVATANDPLKTALYHRVGVQFGYLLRLIATAKRGKERSAAMDKLDEAMKAATVEKQQAALDDLRDEVEEK